MKHTSRLRKAARISLILFFAVIVAGSVVRTTGSGMGCPDWPKCFGYLVPPTDIEPLLFHAAHTYEKGQMVVQSDTLWVANEGFLSGEKFQRTNWHKYPKHDYAIFNPVQTWIEYVNRLATAVFAIPVLLMCVFAFQRMRKTGDRLTLMLALGSMVFIGFEAWLGKLVVDGNLATSSVSLHMIGSLAIILCIMGVLVRIAERKGESTLPRGVCTLLILSLLLSIVQMMLGIQVREETDVIAGANSDRSQWIGMMGIVFYVHRSFSILVVVLSGFVWWKLRHHELVSWGRALAAIVGLEVFAGIVLAYFSMPAFMQPLHLLFAVMIFSLSAYFLLRLAKQKTNPAHTNH